MLIENGFTRDGPFWRLERDEYRYLVEVQGSKFSTGQYQGHYYLGIQLGVFSLAIEWLFALRGWIESSLKRPVPESFLPNAVSICHFSTSLSQLDEELGWDGSRPNFILSPDLEIASKQARKITEGFALILPGFVRKFSSIEPLVEYQQRGWGLGARSSRGDLHSAAGCILLDDLETARSLIERAVKPGSDQFTRSRAEKLMAEIARRSRKQE